MQTAIGIDLGTTYSSVAVVRDGVPIIPAGYQGLLIWNRRE